ncbi:MAG: hypothetical protein V4689_21245 [Verrucomicrobiota bacterium]
MTIPQNLLKFHFKGISSAALSSLVTFCQKNTMKRLLAIILFLGFVPSLQADWDYNDLTLDELMAQSSLIVVAEIKTISEATEEGRVTQEIIFTPITILRGQPDPKGIPYRASYVPKLCAPPESHYINSPPGTKYLLFLTKNKDSYVSVLGPCGALAVNDYLGERVFWYTDDSKAQRFSEQWKEKPLAEVITRITEKAGQGGAVQPATAPESTPEGGTKSQPKSEPAPR